MEAKNLFHESTVKNDVKNQFPASYTSNSLQVQPGRHQLTTVDNNFTSNHSETLTRSGSGSNEISSIDIDMNINSVQKSNLSNGDGSQANANKLISENNFKTSTAYIQNASGNFTKVNNNNNNNSSTANNNRIIVSSANQQFGPNQHHYQHQQQLTTTNMPKNEPVKLVYPAVSGTQVIGGTQSGTTAQQQGGTTVLNMNNRIAYTTTTLPNGTISLSHQQQNLLQQSTGAKTSIQSQQLIIKNQGSGASVISSTAPGIYTMTKTINNQAGQNMQMPANVQIVNVARPSGPQTNQQKIVGLSPRVVLSPQIVANRPQNAGQITLSTIQNLQHSQTGSTLLLKSESGQLQLLRIGPAPNQNQLQPNLSTGNQNQTIRLQTVPAPTSSASGNTIYVNTTSTQQPHVYTTSQIVTTPVATTTTNVVPALTTHHLTAQQHQQIQQLQHSTHNSGQTVVLTNTTAPTLTNQQPVQQPAPTAVAAKSLDNSKEKCRKFLTNLIELSKREPKPVERNVRTLIQELVDARVEPEEFCERLERLLNASPQPCLIGFLKKSLPLLRQSLVTKEIVIEGINPPAANVAFSTITTTNIPAQIRPIGQTGTVGQTQIRMITQQTVPPTKVGQTTIRQTTPMNRVQASSLQQHPQQLQTGPRLSLSQIRPGTIVQTQPGQHHLQIQQQQQQQPTLISSQPPALHPVSSNIITSQSTAKKQSLASLEKAEKKNAMSAAATAATSFYQPSSVYGDDDINDVAAMGGVNLAEETQRILGSTEFVGVQIRSCKDEVFLNLPQLQQKIRAIMAKHGLEEPNNDVAVLVSHATQERLKNILEKLAIIAEHRIDVIKMDPRYEVTKDVRGQIKFLEELDKAEQKRHEEQEREMLMRAAKSRSKTEDPEQAKLKAKAKEMQRAEMEELRQRDANLTALQAIGPRKKPKLESDTTTSTVTGTSGVGNGVKTTTPLRPRIKRVNLRDMLFYLEQEKESCRSTMLHKAYLK